MSVLGKYRKDDERRDEEERPPAIAKGVEPLPVAVPNKERKSPIMSFSVTTELRKCLQAVRNEKAINLSMWVERTLREAVIDEFPDIAETHL